MQDTIHFNPVDTLLFVSESIEQAGHAVSDSMHHGVLDIFYSFPTFLRVLLLLGGVLFVLWYIMRKNILKYLEDHLLSIAIMVFLCGLFLYVIGFDEGGSEGNAFALFCRASLSSMEMFVSSSDLLEVKKELHHNGLYMTFFSLVHFSAVFVSAVFIVKLLGFKFLSWVELHRLKRHARKDGVHLYVFWGVNDNAIILAESIKAKAETDDRNETTAGEDKSGFKTSRYKFIFVDLPVTEGETSHGRLTFSHFFNFSYGEANRYIEKIQELDGILLSSGVEINGDRISAVGLRTDFYQQMGLSNLGKVIKESPASTFFLLSQDEKVNLEALSVFEEVVKKERAQSESVYDKVAIYCHARKNQVNMKLEMLGHDLKVYMVDSSSLAINQLKKEVRHHPVNFVQPDPDRACAQHPFTSMIIGFGETGRDAFRFLYEFSALVDGNGRQNPRKIYVVDEKLSRLKADFLVKVPAMKDNHDIVWDEAMSTHSPMFWEQLASVVNDLNYVVIAIGDDGEGLALAVDLYEYAYRYRGHMNDFKIYLHVSEKKSVVCLAQIQEYFNKYGEHPDVIEVFGDKESIFSYDILFADMLEKEAKEFYYQYEHISIDICFPDKIQEREKRHEELRNITAEELWDKRRKDLVTLKKVIEVYSKENQDKANVWHILTKRRLAGAIDSNGNTVEERLKTLQRITTRKEGTLDYPEAAEGQEALLLTHLSRCEHLRWNANMELQGFVWGAKGKDYKRKTHGCIVDCDVLEKNNAGVIPFDNGVVELSFKIKL